MAKLIFVLINLSFYLVTNVLAKQVGLIAREKCQQYSKYVYSYESSPILHAWPLAYSVSKCGLSEIPLIVGGVKAKPREFPHMALIGFSKVEKTEPLWRCGGSLVSETFVLTAAHCVKNSEMGHAKLVRLGSIRSNANDDQTKIFKIIKAFSHPKYSPRNKYNDIALLKLSHNVYFNKYIRPACLNVDTNIEWSTAIATGFGRLLYDDEFGSNNLMKVQLNRISHSECQKIFQTNRTWKDGVRDSQFCAGEMAGGKDTCQGDSGGPLQTVLKTPYCMYNIIGVTSFGKFCGFENSPGVYTNVAYYMDWIESNVFKELI